MTTTTDAPPRKPDPMPVLAENVPEVLRRLKRWIVWSWIWRPEKNGGQGGWDKPPLSVQTGHNIDGTSSKNWSDFQTVLRAHQRGNFDGVGIALGTLDNGLTLAGLDLDDARDPATGELSSWGRYYLDVLNSYSEWSPSGTGVKALAFGTLPPGGRDNKRGVELSDRGKYFTVTGNRLDGLPTDVQNRQEALAKIHAIAFAKTFRGTSGPSHLCDRDLALSALAGLNAGRADNYHDWLHVGMAVHAADDSDSMCSAWDEWSRRCPEKYEQGKCTQKWKSFTRGGGIGLGSLIHWARQDGWTPPQNGKQVPPGNKNAARSGDDDPIHLTDRGNAIRLVQERGRDLRHSHPWRKWLVWAEGRWRRDDAATVTLYAKRMIVNFYRLAVEKAKGIGAALESQEDKESMA
jgi:hypothetical protein